MGPYGKPSFSRKNCKDFLNIFFSNTCLVILSVLSVLKISVGSAYRLQDPEMVKKRVGGTIKDRILPLHDNSNFADGSPFENVSKE